MTRNEIAKRQGYHASFITQLKKLQKFTPDLLLAVEVARISGLRPIDHMLPRLRKKYLKEFPYLGSKIKVA